MHGDTSALPKLHQLQQIDSNFPICMAIPKLSDPDEAKN